MQYKTPINYSTCLNGKEDLNFLLIDFFIERGRNGDGDGEGEMLTVAGAVLST